MRIVWGQTSNVILREAERISLSGRMVCDPDPNWWFIFVEFEEDSEEEETDKESAKEESLESED